MSKFYKNYITISFLTMDEPFKPTDADYDIMGVGIGTAISRYQVDEITEDWEVLIESDEIPESEIRDNGFFYDWLEDEDEN